MLSTVKSLIIDIIPYLKSGSLIMAGSLVPLLILRILSRKVQLRSRDISEYVMDEIDPRSELMVARLTPEKSLISSKTLD